MRQFGGTYTLAGNAESHSAYSIYPAIHGINIQSNIIICTVKRCLGFNQHCNTEFCQLESI